ncbi:MAG: DHH family phosphoesterase [Methanobacteriota archaeon]|nr:MAG: DHH family phosphoesterase [Euryarchaeota archaeon]
MEEKYEKLYNRAEEVRRACLSMESPLIVHHYDADGISSAAITYKALLKAGKKPRLLMLNTLSKEDIELLMEEKEIIFVDLGSSIEDMDKLENAIIIDHHQPRDNIKANTINPCNYGIDGGKECSSSTLAYIVFREMPELALVGAAGDMQSPFTGVNRLVLEELRDYYDVVKDISFYGRSNRPLHTFLTYSDAHIIGLKDNYGGAMALINKSGVEHRDGSRWRTYDELTEDEKKRVRSSLLEFLIKTGQKDLVKDVFGEVYVLKKGKLPHKDIREIATTLNSCGRYGAGWLGIEFCLSINGAQERIKKMGREHRYKVKKAREALKKSIVEDGPLIIADGRGVVEANIIGIVCGSLQHELNKTVVGIANRGGEVKISVRSPEKINIGSLLSRIAKKYGGEGGGHNSAGGAEIKKELFSDFLEELKKELKTLLCN